MFMAWCPRRINGILRDMSTPSPDGLVDSYLSRSLILHYPFRTQPTMSDVDMTAGTCCALVSYFANAVHAGHSIEQDVQDAWEQVIARILYRTKGAHPTLRCPAHFLFCATPFDFWGNAAPSLASVPLDTYVETSTLQMGSRSTHEKTSFSARIRPGTQETA